MHRSGFGGSRARRGVRRIRAVRSTSSVCARGQSMPWTLDAVKSKSICSASTTDSRPARSGQPRHGSRCSPTRLMPTPASPHERPSARSRWSWTRRRTRHTRDERHANEHARHTLDPRPPNEHARSLKPRRAQAQLSVPSHVSHGANHCCSDHPKRDPVPTSSAACPCGRLCTSPVAPVGQRWLGSSVGPSHLAVSADEPVDQRDTADRGRGGRAAEARRRRPALTLR